MPLRIQHAVEFKTTTSVQVGWNAARRIDTADWQRGHELDTVDCVPDARCRGGGDFRYVQHIPVRERLSRCRHLLPEALFRRATQDAAFMQK